MNTGNRLVGIDLFAGAGGLTLGAKKAGIDVRFAVEYDKYAAKAYRLNHPTVTMLEKDIRLVNGHDLTVGQRSSTILFGGPPCQGYSTSNQKTRNKDNPQNWLFREFVRITKELEPDWVLLENVKGLVETEKGFFKETIRSSFEDLGYECTEFIPSAVDFGVPQRRTRFFLIGSRHGLRPTLREGKSKIVTVKEAFTNLPVLSNGAATDLLPYKNGVESEYSKELRAIPHRKSSTKSRDMI